MTKKQVIKQVKKQIVELSNLAEKIYSLVDEYNKRQPKNKTIGIQFKFHIKEQEK